MAQHGSGISLLLLSPIQTHHRHLLHPFFTLSLSHPPVQSLALCIVLKLSISVRLLPAHFLNKGHSCCRFLLNKRWQSHNIRRLPDNKTMILSNLNSNITRVTSNSHVNCDMIMFATKWKVFSSALCDSLTLSLFFFCSLTHLLSPSLCFLNTLTCTRTHTHKAHRAYGYSSPLWRVALKLWHPYRLALRWAHFARALRLSVALFQTERQRGGLHTHHSQSVRHSYMKHSHKNTQTGDNKMSLHTESWYLRQAALQNWQVSAEC